MHNLVSKEDYRSDFVVVNETLSPFPSIEGKITPPFALIVYPSSSICFNEERGPFESARMVVYPDNTWRLIVQFWAMEKSPVDICPLVISAAAN